MVTLAELINLVDGADWRWSLDEFEGSSHPGSGLNVLDLERQVQLSTQGISYDWRGLLGLVAAVDQAIWAKLTAYLDEGGSERPVFDIDIFDSTDISVWADDSSPNAVAAVGRIRQLDPAQCR